MTSHGRSSILPSMTGVTLNWTALFVSAIGAAVGSVAGAVIASARNEPPGSSALIGATVGAVLASVATPQAKAMT